MNTRLKPVTVLLSASDMKYVEECAQRLAAFKPRGALRFNAGGDTREQHLRGLQLGMKGELGAARYFKVPVDLALLYPAGGDPGYELVVAGLRLDVKWSNRVDAPLHLIIEPGEELKDVDGYVLTGPGLVVNEVRVHGWTPRDRFLDMHHRRNFGHGPKLAMWRHELMPIEEIVQRQGALPMFEAFRP